MLPPPVGHDRPCTDDDSRGFRGPDHPGVARGTYVGRGEAPAADTRACGGATGMLRMALARLSERIPR